MHVSNNEEPVELYSADTATDVQLSTDVQYANKRYVVECERFLVFVPII